MIDGETKLRRLSSAFPSTMKHDTQLKTKSVTFVTKNNSNSLLKTTVILIIIIVISFCSINTPIDMHTDVLDNQVTDLLDDQSNVFKNSSDDSFLSHSNKEEPDIT